MNNVLILKVRLEVETGPNLECFEARGSVTTEPSFNTNIIAGISVSVLVVLLLLASLVCCQVRRRRTWNYNLDLD